MRSFKVDIQYPNGQIAKLVKGIRKCNFLLIFGFIMLCFVYISGGRFARASEAELNNTMYLYDFQRGSKTLTASAQNYAVTQRQEYYDAYFGELENDQYRERALKKLSENNLTESEIAILQDIYSLSNSLVPMEKAALEYAKNNDTIKAKEIIYSTEYIDGVNLISRDINIAINKILERLEKRKNIFRALQIFFETVFLLCFLNIVILGVKIIHFSNKELITPIGKVSEQMEALSRGDLHYNWDLEADESEVGHMVDSINTMKATFSDMIDEIVNNMELMGDGDYRIELCQEYVGEFEKIKDAMLRITARIRENFQTIQSVAIQVNQGSNDLSSASDGLAQACTSQAAQVSDIMILVDELMGVMEDNAKQANEAVKISKSSESTLIEHKDKLDLLGNTIAELRECTELMFASIDKIDNIIDETDMLSLNASIEAARAGEFGKGFGIVADQVKKMAIDSANANNEIKENIYKILEVLKKIDGFSLYSSNNMEEVLIGTNETSQRLENIVARLRKVEKNLSRINSNIEVVAGVVDNNSATSEEAAAISQQEKAQVELLVKMLEMYKV